METSKADIEALNASGVRLIGKFHIKDEKIIQTRQLEGLRAVESGKSGILRHTSYLREILINDLVSTLYKKTPPTAWLGALRRVVHLPISFVGGVNTVKKAESLINAGADRIGVNSVLSENFYFARGLVNAFGAQSVLIHVDARKVNGIYWPFTHSGRVKMDTHLAGWLARLEEYVDCELLLTSIATEGTLTGFPRDLAEIVFENFKGRVMLTGGFGNCNQVFEQQLSFPGTAVASASLFRSVPKTTNLSEAM